MLYEINGYDGHWASRDRLATHSGGHRIYTTATNRKAADALVKAWMSANPPVDGDARLSVLTKSARGDRYGSDLWVGVDGKWVRS